MDIFENYIFKNTKNQNFIFYVLWTPIMMAMSIIGKHIHTLYNIVWGLIVLSYRVYRLIIPTSFQNPLYAPKCLYSISAYMECFFGDQVLNPLSKIIYATVWTVDVANTTSFQSISMTETYEDRWFYISIKN